MSSDDPALRLYRLLLRAFPPGFRRRNGDEMLRVFRTRLAEIRERGGALARTRLWLGTLQDVAVNAVAVRWTEWRKSRAGDAPLHDSNDIHATHARRADAMTNDLRYALRALAKSPSFTAVAVVTLALGIGANTAIFSVVDSVVLRPLPYPDGQELVVVWGRMDQRGVTEFPHSPWDFREYQRQSERLEGVAAVATFPQPLGGDDGEPEQVMVGGVSWNFFDVLGVSPALGRDFREEDGVPGEPQPGQAPGFSPPSTAILSHRLWQQRYGGDPDVIGRRVEVAGSAVTVVGVLPEGFELHMPPGSGVTEDADVWTALRIDYEETPRGNVFLRVIGRLEDGATLEQARTDMDRIAANLRESYEGWEDAEFGLDVVSLQEHLTRAVRPVLWALMGAVGFVLLIACANVSNLLLVRATTREKELAIRSAMGGSRKRLIRQMLLESGILAAAGAVLGLGIAQAGIELLLFLRPEELPRIDAVALDGSVLLFTAGVAGAAALVFGLAPALQGSRLELVDALRDRSGTGAERRSRRFRSGVVVAEVALSLVLLIGAGLMVRSFAHLQSADPGFRPQGALTFDLTLPQPRYPLSEDRARMNDRLQERLQALPGVTRASAAIPLPLSGQAMNGRYGGEEALGDPQLFRQADYRAVLPGYFETMGTRLLEGRTFTAADQADSTNVVVVDELLAETLWPDASAVGQRFLVRFITAESEWVRVVGVVEHQRRASLAEDGRETVYFTDRYAGSFGILTWVLRTSVPPTSVVEAARREVHALDSQLPLADVRPLTAFVDDAMAQTRFALALIGVFGVLALVLAAVGLYGVLAYAVRQRTAEIGLRMAFGAQRESILKMVVGRGMTLTGAGVALGLGGALGLTRLISDMLVGVAPTDPATFAGISLLFLAVAAAACAIPALRATRVDPATALRED